MSTRFALVALCAAVFAASGRADYVISSQLDSPTGPVYSYSSPSYPWVTAPLFLIGELPTTLLGNANVKIAEIRSDFLDAETWGLPVTGFRALPFTLLVNLTDSASGKAGTLAFPATVTGVVGPGGLAVDSQEFIGSAKRSMTLGDNNYTVTLTREPINYDTNDKYIHDDFTAHVEVAPAPPAQTAPEPSTLLLTGLGGPSLLACLRRRRR